MFDANQLEQVELSITKAKKQIALMEACGRLSKNRDFKKLIDEGYLKDEAVALVHRKGDFSMAEDHHQKYIIDAINSISFFRNYLTMTLRQGDAAKQSLKAHEETREAILADDLIGEQ